MEEISFIRHIIISVQRASVETSGYGVSIGPRVGSSGVGRRQD